MPMPKILLEAKEIDRALTRISHEIIERNKGVENLCLLGVQKGGLHISRRIAKKISEIEKTPILCGSLDISFYRDDISIRKKTGASRTEIDFDISGMKVIIIDDVIFTGRSIRAAMDAIMDIGRPALIQLAVLIDRGHRELPIRADYIGKNIPTSLDEQVDLMLSEDGDDDAVILRRAE